MAKKDKNKGDKEKKGAASIITTVILIFLMILIILAGFCMIVKFDVAGFGNDVMRPLIEDIPVIKHILPELDENNIDEVVSEQPYETLEEATKDIVKLKKEIDKLEKENADNISKVEVLTDELEKLKKYEEEYTAFEAKVKEYENEVVYGESAIDISEYQKYYEQIDPERAEELYKQVVASLAAEEKAKELANTYSKMDPGQAAAALEELDDSIALVCDVLLDMTEKNRAAIMDEMTPAFAAKVTKKIYSETK